MAVHIVARSEDVPEGGHLLLQLEGREIGLYRVNGEFFALNNYCPHQGAPMCAGYVSGTTLASGVYEYQHGRSGEIIRCPWHGWEFDIKTGLSLFSSRVRVKIYKVIVEDDQIGIVFGK
ncbi:Rieske (2Fe-2S) protein [Paenibacillus lemnae]|uniref:Rieske 2Fe-2S domain-containing protein n=1 Tax=Paenibacillus lemnae TaxID=1330551 RepID=A0A848M2Z7_PAELE|nr:Rieske 2Fe-2S domain-containing protein [Paenibacillus lemnae]NMO94223.1 Rieske 2Fe-2S domain-containing protein [Paenibacillus lemnae]